MRPVPQCALDFLREHEGCVLRVYDDARPAYVLKVGDDPVGTLTAGYGHTGSELHASLEVTQAKAEIWLAQDAGAAARKVGAIIGQVVDELTEHQWAALISFAFNVGADPKWTIWKRLKARQFDQVPLELMRFVNARGKKLQGLVNRRAAEVALWSTDEPGSVPVDLPSSVTRLETTPPTKADPTPAHKSGGVLAAVGAACAGVVSAAKDILTPDNANHALGLIQPYADKSPIVAHMSQGIATVGAVLALFTAWALLRKKKEAQR